MPRQEGKNQKGTDVQEECTTGSDAQRNLELVTHDAALQGWSDIFQTDSDDEGESEEESFSPIGMQQFSLKFHGNISLSLLQARTAFSDGSDSTGLVLWGASVALAQYLSHHPELVQGKRVMEVGCGGALPSLLSSQLGATAVVATDFRTATLDHVRYHSTLNNSTIHVERVDWEDLETIPTFEPDVILAADVIYGVGLVPPLARTICQALPPHGKLVIATRDGRRGIDEFRQIMKEDFVEEVTESSRDQSYLPEIPSEIRDNEISRDRWNGRHSIYTFRRRATDS